MYYKKAWSAEIEVEDSSTLEDLHLIIQQAVRFDNDHLFCFFVSRSDRSRQREYFDDENEKIYTVELAQLFPLPNKMCLFYLFDWGDEWIFKISRTRKRPHEPVAGTEYPVKISETGVKPDQYP